MAQNGWSAPPKPSPVPPAAAAATSSSKAASGWGESPAAPGTWAAAPPTTPIAGTTPTVVPSGWGPPGVTSPASWNGKPASTAAASTPVQNNGARMPSPTRPGVQRPADAEVAALASKVDGLSTEETEVEDLVVAKKADNLVESAQDVEVTLADLQADADAPLYSGISTFEDLHLHPDLLKGIYGMGFQRPSKIQERALPLLLANPPKNMIGQSQSGTGKTAAFVLTMLSRINYIDPRPQVVCLAPARELARQIMDVVKEMGKYTPVTTCFAIKDAFKRGQKLEGQVIVGTPGTVMTAMKNRDIDLSQVKLFVMDEADNMLDQQGLGDQSIRVKKGIPPTAQIVLFSATFPPAVRDYAATFAPDANMISLRREELSVEGIKQFYMDCNDEPHKQEVLCAIYGLLTIGQSIIFCRRRNVADQLAAALTRDGHECLVLHAGLDPEQRDKAIDDFRDGRCKVLITTNVIARGIDILQVNLVVNYDIPLDSQNRPDPETYLHRIGRTGRFGRTGVSINFCHDQQSYIEMKAIESHFGRPIVRVPTSSYPDIEKILKAAVKNLPPK
ncbi:P-loop containing nucleoside triphosphate hydrolase protein [Geranomyces variabilis]|nr:P-loop containing nucleoside triphosphate hydrolase protein [Geranomyces variabilis]KAJ3135460.1 RNA helicase required for poly(A+) mRNA export [Geranomyces variabilis]